MASGETSEPCHLDEEGVREDVQSTDHDDVSLAHRAACGGLPPCILVAHPFSRVAHPFRVCL